MQRFLIAGDHYIVRSGISLLIKEAILNVEIDECRDGYCIQHKLNAYNYDLAIIDVSMPSTDPVNLLRKIFDRWPHLKILILACKDTFITKYQQMGVRGFIDKGAEGSDILQTIMAILNT